MKKPLIALTSLLVGQLCAEGIHRKCFLDAPRIFEDVSETLCFDHCHVNSRGNHLLAEAIIPAFLERLPEQRVPDSSPLEVHASVER